MKKGKEIKLFPEAIILGMSLTGLHTVRSLGRHGVSIIGVDYDPTKIGFFSKYCKKLTCPHPRKFEKLFINFLLDKAKKSKSKTVLIPTNDEFLLSISRNREILDRYFFYNLPSAENIEKLNNKEAFYNFAVKYNYPVPKTYFPNGVISVGEIAEEIDYPCIIKMKYGYYYQDLGLKAIKINSKNELIENYHKIFKSFNDVMIQEIVSGKDDQQYSLYSYFNNNSVPLATLTSRKLRQLPIEFGVGTLVESCEEFKIEELGLSLLNKVSFQGLSEIEFKRDERDNQFKIIEVNTRPWMQINLATKCGIDFCYLSYQDLIEKNAFSINNIKLGVKWLCFESDCYASFGSSGYIRKGLMTFTDWIYSLKGEKVYAYFAWDDIKPFMHKVLNFIKMFIKKMKKTFFSQILPIVFTDLK